MGRGNFKNYPCPLGIDLWTVKSAQRLVQSCHAYEAWRPCKKFPVCPLRCRSLRTWTVLVWTSDASTAFQHRGTLSPNGGSKQGKTVLRRKMLPEERSVVIGCTATTTRSEIYKRILGSLGVEIPTTTSNRDEAFITNDKRMENEQALCDADLVDHKLESDPRSSAGYSGST